MNYPLVQSEMLHLIRAVLAPLAQLFLNRLCHRVYKPSRDPNFIQLYFLLTTGEEMRVSSHFFATKNISSPVLLQKWNPTRTVSSGKRA